MCFWEIRVYLESLILFSYWNNMGRFILIKKCLPGQGLGVEVAMQQLHFGQLISSMVVLQLRRSSRNGRVRLVQIFHSFSQMELHIVLVEVRYDNIIPLLWHWDVNLFPFYVATLFFDCKTHFSGIQPFREWGQF